MVRGYGVAGAVRYKDRGRNKLPILFSLLVLRLLAPWLAKAVTPAGWNPEQKVEQKGLNN